MAEINVTAGSQAILTLGNIGANLVEPGIAGGLKIPLVQDVTVSAAPGTVRYSTLDSPSSRAFTTVNENEVSFNMLVDDQVFFGEDGGNVTNAVANNGLFTTSANKTEIEFSIAFEGADQDDYYLKGQGFIGGLAPTASIDQAVWLSPGTIIVNGELSKLTVT